MPRWTKVQLNIARDVYKAHPDLPRSQVARLATNRLQNLGYKVSLNGVLRKVIVTSMDPHYHTRPDGRSPIRGPHTAERRERIAEGMRRTWATRVTPPPCPSLTSASEQGPSDSELGISLTPPGSQGPKQKPKGRLKKVKPPPKEVIYHETFPSPSPVYPPQVIDDEPGWRERYLAEVAQGLHGAPLLLKLVPAIYRGDQVLLRADVDYACFIRYSIDGQDILVLRSDVKVKELGPRRVIIRRRPKVFSPTHDAVIKKVAEENPTFRRSDLAKRSIDVLAEAGYTFKYSQIYGRLTKLRLGADQNSQESHHSPQP